MTDLEWNKPKSNHLAVHLQRGNAHSRGNAQYSSETLGLREGESALHGRIYPNVSVLAEPPEPARSKPLSRIAVRRDDKIVLVTLQEVLWIQSKGNLLCFHLAADAYDCRMTMKEIAMMIDQDCFLRIHRKRSSI